MAIGLAMYLVSRRTTLSTETILNLGLGFQIVGAFGIASVSIGTASLSM